MTRNSQATGMESNRWNNPASNDFPPLSSHESAATGQHNPPVPQNRQPSRRNLSNNWRPDSASHQRDRSGTLRGGANGHEGARSPPRSQFDRPWEAPEPGAKQHRFPDTSHVPCKFFLAGQCQAGHTCPFAHTTQPSDAQCKYFMKGQCKYGTSCLLIHATQDGRVLNRPPPDSNNGLSIGSRINPRSQQQQQGQSALSDNLSGRGIQDTFSHQIPTFQTQAYDLPQALTRDAQNATRSPAGLTALDAPMPASFDSQGISIMARHGPVAASMPGALLGPQSPPASLPRPIARANGQSATRNDLGSSPEQGLEAPGARPMRAAGSFSTARRMASTLPRNGYEFDPSWEQGNGEFVGGENVVPSDLSTLLNPQERARRLSGRNDNGMAVRSSLRNVSGQQSNPVGSPPFGQSPSRYSEFFRQQADAGSPEFQPISSPLTRPALQPGSSPGLAPRQGIENLSLSSSPWTNPVSNLTAQMSRARISGENTRPGFGRGPSASHRSPLQRGVGSDDDVPGSIFSLEGLEDTADATTGQRNNIWGNAGLASNRRITPAVPFMKPANVSKKNESANQQ